MPLFSSNYSLESRTPLDFRPSSNTSYNNSSPLYPSARLTSTPLMDSVNYSYKDFSVSPKTSANLSPTSSMGSIRNVSPGLPPIVPPDKHIRRVAPVKRQMDAVTERRVKNFQVRPLKTLTVYQEPHGESPPPFRGSTRSPSPARSIASCRSDRSESVRSSIYGVRSASCGARSTSCGPRRIYPQYSSSVDLEDLEDKEEAPVVFDANLTLVLGCKGKVRHHVKPVPAHLDPGTTSNCLTNKIADFLERTDHVMDEWKRIGRKDNDTSLSEYRRRRSEDRSYRRSSSATNILIKGFQYFSRASSVSRASVGRESSVGEENTAAEVDEVGIQQVFTLWTPAIKCAPIFI